MKIAIIGATGGTGRKVVERALELGHEVIAVARRPEVIPPQSGSSSGRGMYSMRRVWPQSSLVRMW